MSLNSFSLLKLQIGPVQEFIAQSRSTRDLWSGSYLLSFLISAGIRKLGKDFLVFPNPDGQPLLENPATWSAIRSQKDLLTPNLPNLFVAKIPSENCSELAEIVATTIRDKWKEIANACFAKLKSLGILAAEQDTAFLEQAETFLTISWQITPIGGGYAAAFALNGRHLDAVRQTRDFSQNPVPLAGENDSLSGKDYAFVLGKKASGNCNNTEYKQFFKHENDYLSAITLIKRVWHLAYLKQTHDLKTASNEYDIRSTHAIAGRSDEKDDDENTDTANGEKYLAAIAFDGDSIGKWISGELLPTNCDLMEHHVNFSQALSTFALGSARKIVEVNEGFLIYAGGDDVVALVPADAALTCAKELRDAFAEATKNIKGKDGSSPDASAGIAIGHFKSPLQDLIRAAQKAEKTAKNTVGRPAFSINLMKRSGEISNWGAKWDEGGIALYNNIATLMKNEKLSVKFPHRVCQLLEPYLTKSSNLGQLKDAPSFIIADVIRKEFRHAAVRQGSESIADELEILLNTYLTKFGIDSQKALTHIIGLCTAVAFNHRNISKTEKIAERQHI
jgi:CRISPR-associated protein Cmr2